MLNDFSVAVKQILESDADFFLQSSFFPTGRAMMVNRKLNDMVAEMPELRHTVTAIVLYPAFCWVIGTRPGEESETFGQLEYSQNLIVEVTAEQPAFLLENRQKYFAAVQDIVRVMDQAIEHIGRYPGNGRNIQEVLNTVLHGPDPNKGDVSYYKVNKSFEAGVLLLDSLQRDTFSALLSDMEQTSYGYDYYDDFDFAYLYHNTRLLLKHYAGIVWNRACGGRMSDDDLILRDKAVALLDCGTIEDMNAVTLNHNTYRDAYSIAEFMKLINESIRKVGAFPKYGKESRRILEFMTNPEKSALGSGKLDEEFPYGKSTFYEKKRIAITLLTFCLWGCSPAELLDLLAA